MYKYSHSRPIVQLLASIYFLNVFFLSFAALKHSIRRNAINSARVV